MNGYNYSFILNPNDSKCFGRKIKSARGRNQSGKIKYKRYLWALVQKECGYCGKQLTKSSGTMDHIIPHTKKTCNNNYENLVLCCFECNRNKGQRSMLEFIGLLNKCLKK